MFCFIQEVIRLRKWGKFVVSTQRGVGGIAAFCDKSAYDWELISDAILFPTGLYIKKDLIILIATHTEQDLDHESAKDLLNS